MNRDIQLQEKLSTSRLTSWANFGKKISFYLPGMITLNKERGKYPAISITGDRCDLKCDHCNGTLIKTMIPVLTPDELVKKSRYLYEKGNVGCLLSGGCFRDGSMPWMQYVDAIKEIKETTGLILSIHTGPSMDIKTAEHLKKAGVDQVLVDVIGDDETAQKIYHLKNGTALIRQTLDALYGAGLGLAPHVIAGMDYGKIKGEEKAMAIISEYNPEILVIAVLMVLRGTKMEKVIPPSPGEVAHLLADARVMMPNTKISMGCAGFRGKLREEMELLAIDSGINRISIWSEAAINRAKEYDLEIDFHRTCCSTIVRADPYA